MKIHIVKKGDTLYELSKKYGVPLEKIIEANPQLADPNQLSIGMKVKIPSQPVTVTTPQNTIHKHVVKQGDTLWKLSKAWGVPLKNMIEANPQLKNPNALLVGEVVFIPKVTEETENKKAETGVVQGKKNTAVKEIETAPLPKENELPNLPVLPEVNTAPTQLQEVYPAPNVSPIVEKPEKIEKYEDVELHAEINHNLFFQFPIQPQEVVSYEKQPMQIEEVYEKQPVQAIQPIQEKPCPEKGNYPYPKVTPSSFYPGLTAGYPNEEFSAAEQQMPNHNWQPNPQAYFPQAEYNQPYSLTPVQPYYQPVQAEVPYSPCGCSGHMANLPYSIEDYTYANSSYPNENYANVNYSNANYSNANYSNANYANMHYPNMNYPMSVAPGYMENQGFSEWGYPTISGHVGYPEQLAPTAIAPNVSYSGNNPYPGNHSYPMYGPSTGKLDDCYDRQEDQTTLDLNSGDVGEASLNNISDAVEDKAVKQSKPSAKSKAKARTSSVNKTKADQSKARTGVKSRNSYTKKSKKRNPWISR